MKNEAMCRQMLKAAKKLDRYGLISLCGGNISLRNSDGTFLVTPSGMEYEGMTPEDICYLSQDGSVLEGRWRPSSDLPALLYIYEHMPQVNAIIHTHQPYATAVGLVTDYFPPCLVNQIDALRGGVAVAPFTVSSDVGMGILAVKYAGDSLAVILKNHGVIAFGPNLDCCLTAAVYLEEAAKTYLAAKAVQTDIPPLPEEMVEAEAGDMEEWMNYMQASSAGPARQEINNPERR